MNDTPWYERFFGDDYLNVYGREFTPERTEREVSFIDRVLELAPGESVLDLCCGPGRHALLLAEQGMRVTALDLSQQYIDAAAAEAARRGLEIETVRADMRELAYDGRFDAVINMFSSFGYLEDEGEDAKVLSGVARALRPGGRALFDLLNRDWVVRNQLPLDEYFGNGGMKYEEHRHLDPATSRNHITFVAIAPDGERREIVGHHIRLYTLRELIAMFEGAGLRYERAYGSFDGEAYGLDTRRTIVVATKA